MRMSSAFALVTVACKREKKKYILSKVNNKKKTNGHGDIEWKKKKKSRSCYFTEPVSVVLENIEIHQITYRYKT